MSAVGTDVLTRKAGEGDHAEHGGGGVRPQLGRYSLASATTGSSFAALRAGMNPNPTPISVELTNAAMIVVGK